MPKEKTFKDLPIVPDLPIIVSNEIERKSYKFDKVYVEDLKQLGIKWIKELEEIELTKPKETTSIPKELLAFTHPYYFSDDGSNYYSFDSIINFIKHVFNITDEDLK